MDVFWSARLTGAIPPSWSVLSHFDDLRTSVHYIDEAPQAVSAMAATHDAMLLIGRDNGIIDTVRLRGPKRTHRATFPAMHLKACYSIVCTPDDHRVLSAFAGIVAHVDIPSSTVVTRFLGHRLSVRCITAMPRCPHYIATGGRDGVIALWDARCPDMRNALLALHEPHQQPSGRRLRATRYTASVPACLAEGALPQSLEPSVFSETHLMFHRVTGTNTGVGVVRSTNGGVTGLCWLGDGNTIVSASSSEGTLRLWDVRMMAPARSDGTATQDFICHPVAQFEAGAKTRGVAHVAVNRQCSHIAVASIAGTCHVYKVSELFMEQTTPREPTAIVESIAGSFAVTCGWNPGGDTLVVPQPDGFALRSVWGRVRAEGHECRMGPWAEGQGEVAVWADDVTVAVSGPQARGRVAVTTLI